MKSSVNERIPEEDLLGFVHYNPEVIDADRQGKSPYDCKRNCRGGDQKDKRETGSLESNSGILKFGGNIP